MVKIVKLVDILINFCSLEGLKFCEISQIRLRICS